VKTLCVIPARAGSVRIPGKNFALFKGTPMLWRAMNVAQRSAAFDRIVVSTDDANVLKYIESFGADWLMREPDDGTKGTVEVTREAAQAYKEATQFMPDYVCCLYPCTPLLLPEDLRESLREHERMNRWHTVAISGDPIGDAGAFYWHTWGPLMRKESLYVKGHTGFHILPKERVCDINTPEDWARAEQLYEEMHRGNEPN
jgi:pseudaminic acid cytidylyltransferase